MLLRSKRTKLPRQPERPEGTCLCGKTPVLAPSKNRRHLSIPHCYCYDCKAVFTKPLHQQNHSDHQIGTYTVFPPRNKVLPLPDSPVSLEPELPANHSQRRDDSRHFTLWCLHRDTDDVGSYRQSHNSSAVPFCNVGFPLHCSTNQSRCNPRPERWKELQKEFKAFIQCSGQWQNIHQSLLTSLTSTSANEDGNTGAIRTWEQVKPLLKMRSLHNEFGLDPFNDTLTLVHMDTGFPYKSRIRQQYDDIEDYLRVVGAPEGHTLVHPSSAERMGTENKLGDIRALDAIAKSQGTWRPVTCFGYGPCPLTTTKDIVKRAWSCASAHAASGAAFASKLTCTHPDGRRSTRGSSDVDGDGTWFHQEHVDMLAEMELRVFIVTRPDAAGTRGLSGEVVGVCCTAPVGDNLKAYEADRTTYRRLKTTQRATRKFALGVFEALRGPGFAESRLFESLEVGCRLDISVNDEGLLFVNEITRWFGAHYFSDFWSEAFPARMCKEYADSWARYCERVE